MTGEASLKRRGLLIVYGFEWCNPNGDPAFDNEPRIWEGRVLVTDVFLKRRIRDYIDYKYNEKDGKIIFLKEKEKNGKKMTQEERVDELVDKKGSKGNDTQEIKKILKEKCWDIRVFGCMIPIPRDNTNEGEKGKALKLIGPVQMTFGVSLNKVEKIECTITNVMPSKEETARGGGIGRKYVVPVAIVEQYIFVNDITAKESGMTESDYNLLLEALKNLKLTPTCNTSSKILTPLMIVELEFKNEKYASIFGLLEAEEKKENPSSLFDFNIKCSRLTQKLMELKNNNVIEEPKIYIKSGYKELFEGLNSLKTEPF